MITKIESRKNQKIKDLMNSKFLKENKLFKIEGFHAFEMAKDSGVLVSVFSTKEIKDFDGQQLIVSPSIMESISSAKSPQGIICVCKYTEEKPLTSSKVLLLDNVSNPGNLGTLLRTALAFGYNDVILRGGCSQYNEKVLQSTQGAIFELNIINRFDKKLVQGYNIIATEIKGSVDLSTISNPGKHVLVLGNEAHGVSKELLEIADTKVRINIQNIESLNVAVAGAIAMYGLSK
jgi:TrmH family RNA methyltransferase